MKSMRRLLSIALAALISATPIFSAVSAFAVSSIDAKVGVATALTSEHFEYGSDANRLKITELPTGGSLRTSYDTNVMIGQEISVSETLYYRASEGTQSDNIRYIVYSAQDPENTQSDEKTLSIRIVSATPPSVSDINKPTVSGAQTVYFSASDFTSAYDSGPDAGNLAGITITSIPDSNKGTLLLGNVAVDSGDPISINNLNSLVFAPLANIAPPGGSTPVSFKWTATGEYGNLTSNEASVNMNFDNSDTVPTISNVTISTARNTTYTFNSGNFTDRYSDPSSMSAISIESLPNANVGYLRYDNQNLTAANTVLPRLISVSDISRLTFVQAANNTALSASFTWKATNGKNYSSAAACTINITYTLTVRNFSKSGNSGQQLAITYGDFVSNFTGSTSNAVIKAIQIDAPPSYTNLGLLYAGNDLAETGEKVTLNNNPGNNYQVFRFNAANLVGTTSFRYRVSEDGTNFSGYATITLNIGYTLKAGNFAVSSAGNSYSFGTNAAALFSDACTFSSANATLSSIQIVQIQGSNCKLYYNNNELQVNTRLSPAQLQHLRFESTSGNTGSFQYKVSDTTAPDTFSSNNGTVTINVGNNTPTIDDFSITVSNKSNFFTFSQSLFENEFNDSDGDKIAKIKIVTLPNEYRGTLRYSGSNINAGYELNASDANKLTFVPYSGYEGNTSFTWAASDGKVFSSSDYCYVTVTDDDIRPTLSNGYVSTNKNTNYNFKLTDFTNLFDDNSGYELTRITITGLPYNTTGILYLSNKTVTRDQQISRNEIQHLRFVPANDYTGTASFTFTASSTAGTSSSATMSIYVGVQSGNAPIIRSFSTDGGVITSRTVRLLINAYDSSYGTPSQMAFSVNGGSYGSWVAYKTSYDYTLPNSEGIYVIRVKVRNSAGHESAPASLTVSYDRSRPEPVYASVSTDRRTVSVTFNKSIEAESSNLRGYISFGYSGTARLNLNNNDSVTVSGATLTIKLNSSLSTSYDTVYIESGAVSGTSGGDTNRDETATLEFASGYRLEGYSKNNRRCDVVLDERKPSSGRIRAGIAPDSLRNIASELDYSGGMLTFKMPASSGSASARELTLPGDVLFSNTNRGKIALIALTDSFATIIINTDWLYRSAYDKNAPITVILQANASSHAVNLSNVGSSYTVTIECGSQELSAFENQAVELSIPFNTNDPDTAVICSGNGGAQSIPLYSSRYSGGYVTARIRSAGTYFAAQNIQSYSDVPTSHWAYEYIRALSAKAIFEGMGSGYFEPNGPLTRAQYIKALVTALDLVNDNAVSSFSDVRSTDWHYSFISSAVNAGIINSGSGQFNPDSPITREDMCLFAYRAASPAGFTYPVVSGQVSFSDRGSISSGAQTAVNTLSQAGIINGYPDGTFQPQGTSVRAEVSKLIDLILGCMN